MSFAGGFSFHGRPAAGKQQWRPGADAPKMTVELTLQATGLDDKDVLSKSDPLCILYVQVIYFILIEYYYNYTLLSVH